MRDRSLELDYLKSAITLENPFMKIEDFFNWIEQKKKNVCHKITRINFSDMNNWEFDEKTSNLVHTSGKFFSILGINVKTNWGNVAKWYQPIINQPEIGLLGIITKKFNDILYFLMQAKIEPGNINSVQLSPTLQATKSNYNKVHHGKAPLYLEYFLGNTTKTKVILDQLQSEQGARFLKKRNRNIIVEVEGDVEVKENFCWLTLGQIKQLLSHDNIVNMDTRTVISGIPFGHYTKEIVDFYEVIGSLTSIGNTYESVMLMSTLDFERQLFEIEEIISWITRLKSKYELDVSVIPLNEVKGWIRDNDSIHHEQNKYFSVIAIRAEIENREVDIWTQPLVKSAQEGIIAFIIKKINGIYHFLVQAKLEAGNLDIIELTPTIQCLTGNYRKGINEYEPEFLDYILNANEEQICFSTYQSEEGGRFFKEQNKNLIIEATEDFPNELPENYMWMTLNQLKTFIRFNNYLNIQARSLIASIKFF